MASWLDGKVVENRRLNDYLTALIVDVDLGGYEAGQFVRIGLRDGDEVLARPYSLVNTPQEPHLEVYFNIVEDGPLSPRLFDLRAGDDVVVSSNPSGFLTVSEVPDCKHLWMIATGTGIGPFLAILKSEPAWQRFEKVILCYSVSYGAAIDAGRQSRTARRVEHQRRRFARHDVRQLEHDYRRQHRAGFARDEETSSPRPRPFHHREIPLVFAAQDVD
jgi:ferredoxin-NADP reductase